MTRKGSQVQVLYGPRASLVPLLNRREFSAGVSEDGDIFDASGRSRISALSLMERLRQPE